ncbi:MAG: hypothetical protein AB1589_24790 [Cyanobacteriota bacterium]
MMLLHGNGSKLALVVANSVVEQEYYIIWLLSSSHIAASYPFKRPN